MRPGSMDEIVAELTRARAALAAEQKAHARTRKVLDTAISLHIAYSERGEHVHVEDIDACIADWRALPPAPGDAPAVQLPPEPAPEIDYDGLDDGIRETVRFLRSHGYRTCDSGDGSKAPTMEGAMDAPMVAILHDDRATLCSAADTLRAFIRNAEPERGWEVEASYSTADHKTLLVATAAAVPASDNPPPGAPFPGTPDGCLCHWETYSSPCPIHGTDKIGNHFDTITVRGVTVRRTADGQWSSGWDCDRLVSVWNNECEECGRGADTYIAQVSWRLPDQRMGGEGTDGDHPTPRAALEALAAKVGEAWR